MPDQTSDGILLVGISGPSSSGKTTISRLLRDILIGSPDFHTFILHEDDFYKTDNEIPVNEEGLQDWDCLEAIDLPLFERVLKYVKDNGKLPADFESKEDKNDVGKVDVEQSTRDWCEEQTANIAKAKPGTKVTIAIVDGFLLYSKEMALLSSYLDVKLFLRTNFSTAKHRREARSGYVTLEGFWEDPPGYVEKVVWPNYVKDHAFLFEGGNVEGAYNKVCDELGINGMPREAEGDMSKCLKWAHAQVCSQVQKKLTASQ